ncbi:MAG TPA: hypothetical protein PKE29_13855 [Phycisphaerales bacterium]|nr:hypothetical protein [Phycisphaerales bacterium]
MRSPPSLSPSPSLSPCTLPCFALAAGLLLALPHAAMAQKSHQFDVNTPITIPLGAPGTTFGPADPYPSSVTVSGVNAPIGEVKVVLRGFTHTFMYDLDMLLVGPGGQSVLIVNRAGGVSPGPMNVEYIFSQDALPMPISAIAPSGRYRPTRDPGNAVIALNAPAPGLPYALSLDAFKGRSANGTWSLYILDRAGGDVGSMTGWSLIIAEAPAYANPSPITIPAGAPVTTVGPAAPYPSTTIVDGLEGSVRSVQVMLTNLSHTYQRDLRFMLQSPDGQTCMLYGNCGDSTDWVNADLIFDDNAASGMPTTFVPVAPGTYRPTIGNFFATPPANMAAPAPAGPYGTTLSVFNGTNPNGAWRLWVEDSTGGDTGTLAGGWSVIVNGQSCPADFNKSGGLEVQDIFDFLNAWLATCP